MQSMAHIMNPNDYHMMSDQSYGSLITDSTLDQTVDTDVTDGCYICVSWCDGRLGATLYYTTDRSVRILPEVEDNNLELIQALLIQTQPNHVIVSCKCDHKLTQVLQELTTDLNPIDAMDSQQLIDTTNRDTDEVMSSTSNSYPMHSSHTLVGEECDDGRTRRSHISECLSPKSLHFTVNTVSNTFFDFENSKIRILSIDLKNVSGVEFDDENQKFVFISSVIDFWDNNTLRSFGALLRFLDTNCVEMQSQAIGGSVEISSISRLYLDHLVAIDRNTFESLQIFQQEWHPSAAKQGLNQKEGLSLYGLFNCCLSKVGSNYLRKIFLHPIQDIEILNDRLNVIEFFVDPNNFSIRDNLCQHLKHMKSIKGVLGRLTTVAFTVKDFKTICDNLLHAMRIKEIVDRHNLLLKVFRQISQSFTEDIVLFANMIVKVVDFEKSLQTQTFEVNYGIDEELDNIKSEYNRLSSLLDAVAISERQLYGDRLQEVHCMYIPQIGFLTTALDTGSELSVTSDSNDLETLLIVADRVYYRTPKTLELDERFGDIHSAIIDRQMKIINQLQEYIADFKPLFFTIERLCAKLDALIAMSQTAINYRYNRPNISNIDAIEIIEGRHPLMELVSKAFVANDYYSGNCYNKVKIITGPNACGKSVYLKQICIIVYMAHIGSYVPALTANIPIIDRIFTRLHTPESMSMRLSTFMLDLNQMSNAIKYTTNRSLVLVDEFGKGTQSIDGSALMAATLNHWLTTEIPHLIVSTHFQCLPSLLNNNYLIDCQTFQFIRDGNQMTYLFKLINGLFNQSIASHIAFLAAIPETIIIRGLQLIDNISLNQFIEPLNLPQIQHKYDKYEAIANEFLKLNLNSEQQIQDFFNNHIVNL